MGEPKVDELAARLSAAELAEWQAFYLIEPFGEARADDRARGLMAIAAAAGGAKKVKPGDFLPPWEPPLTPAERTARALAQLDAIAKPSGDA